MRRVGADLYRCKDCSTTWVRHKSASAYSLAGWHARWGGRCVRQRTV